MKPVAIWLADERGEIHPYEIKPDGCLLRLWKRLGMVLWPALWFVFGWLVGQAGA